MGIHITVKYSGYNIINNFVSNYDIINSTAFLNNIKQQTTFVWSYSKKHHDIYIL